VQLRSEARDASQWSSRPLKMYTQPLSDILASPCDSTKEIFDCNVGRRAIVGQGRGHELRNNQRGRLGSGVYQLLDIFKAAVRILLKYGNSFLESRMIHDLRIISDLVRSDHADESVGKGGGHECVVTNWIARNSSERHTSSLREPDCCREQQDVAEGGKLAFLLKFEHEAFVLLGPAGANVGRCVHRITFNSVRSVSEERM